jgi:hypothetical protein
MGVDRLVKVAVNVMFNDERENHWSGQMIDNVHMLTLMDGLNLFYVVPASIRNWWWPEKNALEGRTPEIQGCRKATGLGY